MALILSRHGSADRNRLPCVCPADSPRQEGLLQAIAWPSHPPTWTSQGEFRARAGMPVGSDARAQALAQLIGSLTNLSRRPKAVRRGHAVPVRSAALEREAWGARAQ